MKAVSRERRGSGVYLCRYLLLTPAICIRNVVKTGANFKHIKNLDEVRTLSIYRYLNFLDITWCT